LAEALNPDKADYIAAMLQLLGQEGKDSSSHSLSLVLAPMAPCLPIPPMQEVSWNCPQKEQLPD